MLGVFVGVTFYLKPCGSMNDRAGPGGVWRDLVLIEAIQGR